MLAVGADGQACSARRPRYSRRWRAHSERIYGHMRIRRPKIRRPKIRRSRSRLRERTRICPVKKFENLVEARILCLLTITVARTATTISPNSSHSPTIRSPFARNAAKSRSARCIPPRRSNSRDLVSIAPTSPSERKRIHVTEQPKQGNEPNNQGQQTLENKATRRILWITRILRPQPSIRLAQQLFVRSSCMHGDLFS